MAKKQIIEKHHDLTIEKVTGLHKSGKETIVVRDSGGHNQSDGERIAKMNYIKQQFGERIDRPIVIQRDKRRE
jgi:hypothetical protein